MTQYTNFQDVGQISHDSNLPPPSATAALFDPIDIENAFGLAVDDARKQLAWIRFHALNDPDELVIISRWRLRQFMEAAEALLIASEMMQPIYIKSRLKGSGVPLETWKETASLAFKFRKMFLNERRDKEAILDAWQSASETDSELLTNLLNSRK